MKSEADVKQGDGWLLLLAASLLLLCFVCGGDSAKSNLGAMAAQLLAIPILVLALFQCARRDRFQHATTRWGLAAAAMIVLVPLIQLLPLPTSLWSLPTGRVSLLQDLNAAGVESVYQRWSLSPAATERDLLFLLPGLALFFSMLALGRSAWQRMLGAIMALSIGNLVFAIVQVAAGQDSILNLYPDFVPRLAGIFANTNHQADLLAIGLMLATVFLLDALKRIRESGRSGAEVGALIFIALILVVALPLVGSRAGVIVAMVMLMGALLSFGSPPVRTFRESRLLQIGLVLVLVVFVIGLQAGIAWMKSDAGDSAIEGSRYRISSETLTIGFEHAPLGAGIGTFIPAFQQGASEDFLMSAYVNNAHNEYAQWWLEGGVVGVLAVLLALVALLKTLIVLLRLYPGSRTRVCGIAAMMGIGVIVLHSTVDYPLRTPALSAVFAVLSGIAIAAASSRSSVRSPSRRDDRWPDDHSRTSRGQIPVVIEQSLFRAPALIVAPAEL
jgi:O-antigen ligase